MEKMCAEYFRGYRVEDNLIKGYLEGENVFTNFLNNLQKLGYSFSVRTSRNFQKGSSSDHDYYQTYGPISIKFAGGVPYYNAKDIYMHCAYGEKYYQKKAINNKQDHPTGTKVRRRMQGTKKLGCPASLKVKVKHVFTEEKCESATPPSHWKRRTIVNELYERIADGANLPFAVHYSITLANTHNHPITSSSTKKCKVVSSNSMLNLSVVGTEGLDLVHNIDSEEEGEAPIEANEHLEENSEDREIKQFQETLHELFNEGIYLTDNCIKKEALISSLEKLKEVNSVLREATDQCDGLVLLNEEKKKLKRAGDVALMPPEDLQEIPASKKATFSS